MGVAERKSRYRFSSDPRFGLSVGHLQLPGTHLPEPGASETVLFLAGQCFFGIVYHTRLDLLRLSVAV